MIRVNNREEIEWREGMTVSDLLEHLNYTYHHIIVTVNGELVRREFYDTHIVPDRADVKAIHLIAGG
ncbi:MAG: sulfur carrier protein ThiS [Anaerolineae bacterium]